MIRRVLLIALIAAGVLIIELGTTLVLSHASQFLRGEKSEPISSADVSGTGPGSLVSAVTTTDLISALLDTGAHSARIVYRSTEGDNGAPTVVSGLVFVPRGPAPPGGWPVIAYGHGAMGINEPCAPSLSNDLRGEWSPVVDFLTRGYAVAYPDYQGLGASGIHPFGDSRTAGLNLIDAVRALRATFPEASARWAAFGGSQGGGATWAANEQAAVYAPELSFVGSVALAPAADVTGIVAKAEAGTLTTDQAPLLQWALVSLNRLHPDLDLDDFRRGTAAGFWDVMAACSGPLAQVRSTVLEHLGPHDLSPASAADGDRLRQLLQKWALPQRRLSAPLSVVYGSADTYLDPQWTTTAIERACALGGPIQWRIEAGKGHLDLEVSQQAEWLTDRFAGKPVKGHC